MHALVNVDTLLHQNVGACLCSGAITEGGKSIACSSIVAVTNVVQDSCCLAGILHVKLQNRCLALQTRSEETNMLAQLLGRPGHERQATALTTAVLARGHQRARLRPDRPALVVSSTSWTPDEDFGILLRAARLYDDQVAACV